MDVDDGRHTAVTQSSPRSLASGGDRLDIDPGGPRSVFSTRQWGSPTFRLNPIAAQAPAASTLASHLLPLPLVRSHWMMPESAEVSLSSPTDEQIFRRVTALPPSDQQQTDDVPPPKSRRFCYPACSPPSVDSTSSTVAPSVSLSEFSANLFESLSTPASSFLHRHDYPRYRPLSFPHTDTAGRTSVRASSLSLMPWLVNLSPVRPALDQVMGCVGAIRPPLPTYACPVMQRGDWHSSPSRPVDVCRVTAEQRQQRLLSMPGTDKQSSQTSVTRHCTTSAHSSSSSCSGGIGGHQGNSALTTTY